MELSELKSQWNEVLFALESRNRVAWLTFFDARLASLDDSNLKLDFQIQRSSRVDIHMRIRGQNSRQFCKR